MMDQNEITKMRRRNNFLISKFRMKIEMRRRIESIAKITLYS